MMTRMKIIDVHAHAFPDDLAPRAMEALEGAAGAKALGDGTAGALVCALAEDGVDRAVVASIATRPKQVSRILAWSAEIAARYPALIPFASLHPDLDARAQVDAVVETGVAGVKMHPYYQEFSIDEERLFPIYERLEERGIPLLMHAGYDIAFPRTDIASPARIARAMKRFPALRMIAAHMGGWCAWKEVADELASTNVHVDTACLSGFIRDEEASGLAAAFGPDRVLFGSDYPWESLASARALVERLFPDPCDQARVFSGNFKRLCAS